MEECGVQVEQGARRNRGKVVGVESCLQAQNRIGHSILDAGRRLGRGIKTKQAQKQQSRIRI
jgi:hypothetical protein